jgi:hypothetical protein
MPIPPPPDEILSPPPVPTPAITAWYWWGAGQFWDVQYFEQSSGPIAQKKITMSLDISNTWAVCTSIPHPTLLETLVD